MNFIEKVRQLPNAAKGYLFCDPRRNGEFRFLRKILAGKERPVVLDVGSNIGQYASKVLELAPNARVHCFEPAPRTFEILKQELGNNDNVILNNIALSSSEGMAKFFIYGELDQMNSLELHSRRPTEIGSVLVSTITADHYCAKRNIAEIDLMKIDVEGHELQVLQGAYNLILERKVKAIQFEYNLLWKNTANTLEQALCLVSDYHVYRLTPWGRIYIPGFSGRLENYPTASNYVAILK